MTPHSQDFVLGLTTQSLCFIQCRTGILTKAPTGARRIRPLNRKLVWAVLTMTGSSSMPGHGEIPPNEHRLRLYHTHTQERLDVVYRRGLAYVPDGLSKLDAFLRDHRTGDVHHFDPRLFDLLSDLIGASGRADAEINIICGYRTPWSNEFLRTHTAGVAKHSLHMQAEAIDIRLPGLKTSRLRDIALALGRGGVGYYPGSDFIHVDLGRVRRW